MSALRFTDFSHALAHWAAHEGGKTFLMDLGSGATYTYADFDRHVSAAVHLLRSEGVRLGKIVSVRIRNSADFLIIYFACIRMGAIVNPFPASTSDEELSKALAFIEPRLVILERCAKKLPARTGTLLIGCGNKSLFSQLKPYEGRRASGTVDSKKAAALYLSSGTTGDPKGMLFSHENIIARANAVCRDFGHGHDTVHLGFLPMGHTSITDYSLLPVMYAGGTLIIAENFLSIRQDFWRIIAEDRIRYVQTVPTVLFSILNTDYSDYDSTRLILPYVACGSAPLPLSIQQEFKNKFGIPVANLYGCSETGPAFFDDPRIKGWRPGSIGVPLSVHACELVDEQGKVVLRGVGEIAIKSKTVCIGYYKNPDAYAAAMRVGFFLTGDLARRDAKGRYLYADRKKDIIIKGGSNIFPGEIDEVLFKHPRVLESSTIGVPHDFFGEDIVSFVVSTGDVTDVELIAHCEKHLQYMKCPARIIFLPVIPKTHSGKLLRKKLRALYQERYA